MAYETSRTAVSKLGLLNRFQPVAVLIEGIPFCTRSPHSRFNKWCWSIFGNCTEAASAPPVLPALVLLSIAGGSASDLAFRKKQLKNSRGGPGAKCKLAPRRGVSLTPSRINSKIGVAIRGGGNVSIDRQTVSTEVMTRRAARPTWKRPRGRVCLPLSVPPPPPGAFILSRLAERGHHGGPGREGEGGGGRSNIDPPPPERDSSSLAHAPPRNKPPAMLARKGGKQKGALLGRRGDGETAWTRRTPKGAACAARLWQGSALFLRACARGCGLQGQLRVTLTCV